MGVAFKNEYKEEYRFSEEKLFFTKRVNKCQGLNAE